ncbi:carbon storage regulator CsrA [Paenibacillus sp. OV219]|uniref:carbon storage regulator CsrA n=1 Tax=Paenibacillus sp. OV219 TaxID=1884377 RepID=UPI0008C3420B|nr:carbon storage regulator CsrA [Paenibacillus sp. OV219]SEN64790.1 carbon storage regulator, CsrA [Paenibacillus sp. OV219]
MLVLSRKKGESIIIQDDIEITILEVGTDTIKLGIKAPREVEVLRKELHSMIKQSNQEAATPQASLSELKNKLKKMMKNDEQL